MRRIVYISMYYKRTRTFQDSISDLRYITCWDIIRDEEVIIRMPMYWEVVMIFDKYGEIFTVDEILDGIYGNIMHVTNATKLTIKEQYPEYLI